MNGEFLCRKDLIQSAVDSCQFVKDHCGYQHEYLDFLGFYYCTTNQNLLAITLVSILFTIIIFNLIGTTADRYIGPSLETIAHKLKMSEALAGVTLLALSGGSTDVVSGFVAGGKGAGGVQIVVGALFGAVLFTETIVLARCIQGATIIHANPSTLVRDIVFMLITIVYFLILCVVNTVTPLNACGFFLIYFVYFGIVIYQEKKGTVSTAPLPDHLLPTPAELHRSKSKIGIEHSKSLTSSHISADHHHEHTESLLHGALNIHPSTSLGIVPSHDKNLIHNIKDEEILNLPEPVENKEVEEEEPTKFDQIKEIYNMPLLFIRNLTMPPFEEEDWNLYRTAVSPFLGTLFVIWKFGLFTVFIANWYLWIFYGLITVPIFLWIVISGRHRNLVTTHGGLFAGFAFIISALWLEFFANCFLDFLGLLTVVSGLPLNYLSLTILAWGNSLDDLFIDYYLSRSGHAVMAVTGAYAGQLFNLLFGFGCSFLRNSLGETIHLNIFQNPGSMANTLTLVLIASLALVLSLTLVVGKLTKWVLEKRLMYFLLSFYVGFVVLVTIISFT